MHPRLSFSESAPKSFGIPLSLAIANDRAYKRRQDALKESRRNCYDLEDSILRFRAEKRQLFNGSKSMVSSPITGGGLPGSPSANSVAPIFENQNKPMSPTFLDNTGRAQRRVRYMFYKTSLKCGMNRKRHCSFICPKSF